MKRVFAFVVIFLLIIAFLNFFTKRQSPMPLASPISYPSPTSTGTTVLLNDKKYTVFIYKVNDPTKLKLIPNFAEKKTSQKIIERENCSAGSNAGFYTKNGQPLGFFYSNGKSLSASVHSNPLFNGFFSQTKTGQLELSSHVPYEQAVDFNFIFQSGPLFTPETKLKIASDEMARRILIGKTSDNDFYFLAITQTDNVNSGPLLSDLPSLILNLNETQFLNPKSKFINLLNLDGGSASAFYSEEIKLSELVPIGALLCEKNL